MTRATLVGHFESGEVRLRLASDRPNCTVVERWQDEHWYFVALVTESLGSMVALYCDSGFVRMD